MLISAFLLQNFPLLKFQRNSSTSCFIKQKPQTDQKPSISKCSHGMCMCCGGATETASPKNSSSPTNITGTTLGTAAAVLHIIRRISSGSFGNRLNCILDLPCRLTTFFLVPRTLFRSLAFIFSNAMALFRNKATSFSVLRWM
jgi:hypothetical protein